MGSQSMTGVFGKELLLWSQAVSLEAQLEKCILHISHEKLKRSTA